MNKVERSNITNRRLIIEVRFKSNPVIMDMRGALINSIIQGEFNHFNWEYTSGGIRLYNHIIPDKIDIQVSIEHNIISYIVSNNRTNDEALRLWRNLFGKFNTLFNDISYERIGCRIIGSYKTKSRSYDKIYRNFKNLFKSELFLEDFPANDLGITVKYDNGRYEIGPVNKDDEFYRIRFNNNHYTNKIGVAIDTDNFVLLSNKKNKYTQVKDVCTKVFNLTLSVEYNLYEKMKNF